MEVGEREIVYLSLHCHHQNDSCIKMGSDESRFNGSVGSDGQSHKTVSTNHNLFEEKGEPKRDKQQTSQLLLYPRTLIERSHVLTGQIIIVHTFSVALFPADVVYNYICSPDAHPELSSTNS